MGDAETKSSKKGAKKATLNTQESLSRKKGTKAVGMNSDGQNSHINSALTVGQWVKPSKKDDFIQFSSDVGAQPGDLSLKDYYEWKKDKDAELEFFGISNLATKISDGTNRYYEQHMKKVWPALKEIPEKFFKDQLAFGIALNRIIEAGMITSQEDLQLVYYMCTDECILPTYPVWDPSGVISNGRTSSAVSSNIIGLLYKPYQQPSKVDELNIQRDIKKKILRRIFPGLENKPDNSGVWNEIFSRNFKPFGFDSPRMYDNYSSLMNDKPASLLGFGKNILKNYDVDNEKSFGEAVKESLVGRRRPAVTNRNDETVFSQV